MICTVFYLLVSAGVVGAYGAQPLIDPLPAWRSRKARPSSHASAACRPRTRLRLLEGGARAHPSQSRTDLRQLVGLAAALALPSVVLLMMYGQTRIFFVMARDGLLPERPVARSNRFRTPYIVTIVTGVFVAIAAAFLPVGTLADYSNAGTLFAFAAVSLGVMILRTGIRSGAAVPHPGAVTSSRRCRSPAASAVPQPQRGIKLLFVTWDGDRPGGLFLLRISPQPHRARHHRSAGALAEAPPSVGVGSLPGAPGPEARESD